MVDVVIIGGGPAGVMAAIAAAQNGADVILCERNDRLLRKLRISGKGRCNISNAQQGDLFLGNVLRNPRFLRSSFSNFDNTSLMEYMESIGVKLKVERGQRVFPVSDDANEVAAALEKQLVESGVQVMYDVRVKTVKVGDDGIRVVHINQGEIACRACILAAGGVSYPRTGSTGDGFTIAAKLGHTVTGLHPSLAPIATAEGWAGELQGLSLRNVDLHAWKSGKKVFAERGEMLFTDSGVSGPLVLSASAHMDCDDIGQYTLSIDLKPGLSDEQLDARLLRDFSINKNRILRNSLNELLPKSLIPVIIRLSGIDPEKPCHSITKQERVGLMRLLKGLKLTPTYIGPIDAAIVTRGGVAVNEINPKTMESKLVNGLYFAGEIMDVDAYTGGYNMQIAFTTGYTAGISCAPAKRT